MLRVKKMFYGLLIEALAVMGFILAGAITFDHLANQSDSNPSTQIAPGASERSSLFQLAELPPASRQERAKGNGHWFPFVDESGNFISKVSISW